MVDVLQIAGSLGVGAFLAVIIYLQSQKNIKSYEEQLRQDRIFMEDRMSEIIKQDQKMIERDQDTREANTRAVTELVTVLERMNGRH